MSSPPQITALLRQPDALRGLDHLIERTRRVLNRYMQIPDYKAQQKQVARAA